MSNFAHRTMRPFGTGSSSGLRLARGLRDWLVSALRRHQQRQALCQLDDRLLRDIGAGRDDARLEAAKPFWR